MQDIFFKHSYFLVDSGPSFSPVDTPLDIVAEILNLWPASECELESPSLHVLQ